MANVDKYRAVKQMTGLNGLSKGALLASGPDNVPATIVSQQGLPKGPAMIKEGEIIFSVEAVIGAGNGSYDKGAAILTELQKQLREEGKKFVGLNSTQGT